MSTKRLKRRVLAAVVVILGACALTFARSEDSLAQLMAKADSASAGQQAELCTQVADRELKLTINWYKQNKIEDARSSLQQIVNYSDKAHSAAIHSGKKLKHTEINIRRIAGHLRDLKFNVDVDDQPIIQAAIDKLETFRTELLKSMFGSKNND